MNNSGFFSREGEGGGVVKILEAANVSSKRLRLKLREIYGYGLSLNVGNGLNFS